ncbi:MAG: hypothetical protein U0350_51425 [Caldilineaceae bacterium]
MSQSLDIFVDTDESLVGFVRELESLLNIKFEMVTTDYETWYEFANSEIVATVGGHDFENDCDIEFENYRYDIALRPINYETAAEWQERREKYANRIFDKLKATQRYQLLLVDNLQVKLAEFSPRFAVPIITTT